MIEINWKPSTKILRQFALAALLGFGLLGSLAWFHFEAPTTAKILWAIGAIICTTGLSLPRLILPIYLALTFITFPIGFLISHLVLGILYFGIFTPIALLFRIIGRDRLSRTIQPESKSYWALREEPQHVKSYYHQY